MKQFLLLYWVGTLLLFALFYWDLSPFASFINEFQTNVTVFLTSLTLPHDRMQGYHILINNHYSLVIEKACNGMIPYLFFLASIMAFPATWVHKIRWAVGGYITITLVNILRIWIITQMVIKETHDFSLAHDYLGNILLVLTALVLFVLFVKTKNNIKK